MFFKKSRNIIETELGKAIYVSSDTIEEDMLFLKKNNVKGVIISNDNGYKLNHVDFFKTYDFIEIVIISLYLETDYSAIHYLKKLKVLSLNILCKDNQAIDFSCFPELVTCCFNWRAKTKFLFECTSLEDLSLSKFKGANLENFKNLENLKWLQIYQSSIENLNGIENLYNLERLDLYGNRKLVSFVGIGHLRVLKQLKVSSCKGLNDLDEFSSLENLEKLEINNCGDIKSLLPIKGLKKLNELKFLESTNIVDGNLSPCIGMKDIFFQNRKHYNYTYQELEMIN